MIVVRVSERRLDTKRGLKGLELDNSPCYDWPQLLRRVHLQGKSVVALCQYLLRPKTSASLDKIALRRLTRTLRGLLSRGAGQQGTALSTKSSLPLSGSTAAGGAGGLAATTHSKTASDGSTRPRVTCRSIGWRRSRTDSVAYTTESCATARRRRYRCSSREAQLMFAWSCCLGAAGCSLRARAIRYRCGRVRSRYAL